MVKKADAEAQNKALQGQGIANQRRAIIEGLQGSIEQFQKAVAGTSTSDVMQLVMITQYFDTIKSIGEMDKTNTLFLSHSPTRCATFPNRSCSRCWSRTGRRASAIGLPSPLGPFSIDDWGKRPMRPRITVNLTAGGEFEIWLNEQGSHSEIAAARREK